VADAQLVSQVVAAGLTVLGAWAAAFLGARSANRNTKIVDARAKENAEWERIIWMANMAVSSNPNEANLGISHLQESKDDWNSNPMQATFVRRTIRFVNLANTQAVRGGRTVVTGFQPPPAPPGGP
jgi:hypothetical protein